MFTGIVETVGRIKEVISSGSNRTFWVESSLSADLKADQSVSHSGVCLTVEEVKGNLHRATAIEETLQKTNLQSWQAGTEINIERSLLLNSRLDGHFVQGHVDTTGICKKINERQGSREFEFEFPKKFAELIIEKGSICINGISLTAFEVGKRNFKVAIIPYTFEHTNTRTLKVKDIVNIEFDIIGKYIARRNQLNS